MRLNDKVRKISGLFMMMLVVGMVLVTPTLACPAGTPCGDFIIQSNVSAEDSSNPIKVDINTTLLNGDASKRVINNLLTNNNASSVDQYMKSNGFKQNLKQAKAYTMKVTNNSSVNNIQYVIIPINTNKKNLDSFKILLSSSNLTASYIRVNGTSNYFPNTMNVLENNASYKKLKDNLTDNGYKITTSSVTEVIGQTVDSSTYANNLSISDYAIVRLTATNDTTSKPITAAIDMNSKDVIVLSSGLSSCDVCLVAAKLVCQIPLTILTVGGCLAACAEVGEACAPYCGALVALAVDGACSLGSSWMCKRLHYCS